MELNTFLIDVVHGVEVIDMPGEPMCKMVSYKVVAETALDAFERWQNEPATEFPIAYEGPPVPAILIGIQMA